MNLPTLTLKLFLLDADLIFQFDDLWHVPADYGFKDIDEQQIRQYEATTLIGDDDESIGGVVVVVGTQDGRRHETQEGDLLGYAVSTSAGVLLIILAVQARRERMKGNEFLDTVGVDEKLTVGRRAKQKGSGSIIDGRDLGTAGKQNRNEQNSKEIVIKQGHIDATVRH